MIVRRVFGGWWGGCPVRFRRRPDSWGPGGSLVAMRLSVACGFSGILRSVVSVMVRRCLFWLAVLSAGLALAAVASHLSGGMYNDPIVGVPV